MKMTMARTTEAVHTHTHTHTRSFTEQNNFIRKGGNTFIIDELKDRPDLSS